MIKTANRFLKTITAITAVITLLLPVGTVTAKAAPSPKEEVVYGLLSYDGSVKSIYVVNILEGKEIRDYGSYSEIRNMASTEPLSREEDLIQGTTTADKLYYQGTLETKELPWDISVRYFLDGTELTGPELAGKSGEFQLELSIKEYKGSNPSFYDNYALQVSITLDTKLCENIRAEGATLGLAGRNKQLNFTVLPGQGAELQVSADVRDFKLEPVSINAIRLNLGLEVDEPQLTEQISRLADALKELDSGAGELLSGVKELSEGMTAYVEGLKEFKNGLSELDTGMGALEEGAAALSSGLRELTKQNPALVGGAMSIRQAAFDGVNAQLATMGLGLPALTPQNYGQLLSAIPDLAAVKAQLDGVIEFTEGLKAYTEAVSQLETGATNLEDGVTELKAATGMLASSAKELYDAAVTLNTAMAKLRDGLAAYKEGTAKLQEGSTGFDTELENQIQGILNRISGNSSQVKSFVSEKNTEVSTVQFVMKTEAIQAAEPVIVAEKPKKLNFWQRLLRLFGLY